MSAKDAELDVVGAGLAAIDRIFYVPARDIPIESKVTDGLAQYMETSVLRLEKRKPVYLGTSAGGSVTNTLCSLSVLGIKCDLISAIGDDVNSSILEDDLHDFGIFPRGLRKKRGTVRQYAHIIDLLNHSHRYENSCPLCGNQFRRAPQMKEKDLTLDDHLLLQSAKVLHIDRSAKYIQKLVQVAKQNNKIVSFDLGHVFFFDDDTDASNVIKEILSATTILKTGDQVRKQLEYRWKISSFMDYVKENCHDVKIYVNTLGPKGIEGFIRSNDNDVELFQMPPFNVGRVIDAAGAGDAFHAGLLYSLLENKFDFTSVNCRKSLHFAQALAYLACLLPGAKSHLFYSKQTNTAKQTLLTLIDKIRFGKDPFEEFDEDRIIKFIEGVYKSREPSIVPDLGCRACGPKNAKTEFEQNIDISSNIIVDIFNEYKDKVGTPLVQTDNILQRTLPFDPYSKDLLYIIGSGGSHSAAVYCEYLLHYSKTKVLAKALTPNEYLKIPKKSDVTILLSYSGRGDINPALRKAINDKDNAIVITGWNNSKLLRPAMANNIPVWSLESKVSDRGFVSTIGMLSMMTVFTVVLKEVLGQEKVTKFFAKDNLADLYSDARNTASTQSTYLMERLSNNENNTSKSLRDIFSNLHLVILASGMAYPAAQDFESKLTEGGVCTSEIAEIKNYTHGRYINAYKNKGKRAFVIFSTPQNQQLSDFLYTKFSKSFPVIRLTSKADDFRGTFELMVKQLYLLSFLSRQLRLDLCRPDYPAEAKGLFSYSKIYKPSSNTLDAEES